MAKEIITYGRDGNMNLSYGDPAYTFIVEKLDLLIDAPNEGGCQFWLGNINSLGYGKLWVQKGVNRYFSVHRLVYELGVGAILPDEVIDHTCHNASVKRGECLGGSTCSHRKCVALDHLEKISFAENVSRGAVPLTNRKVCAAGLHDLSFPGAIVAEVSGVRRCHACRLASRRVYDRKDAAKTNRARRERRKNVSG